MRDHRSPEEGQASKGAAYKGKIYRDRDVSDIARELYPFYPNHWVALAILEEDCETGLSTNRLVANEQNPALIGLKARRYSDKHPGTVISIFSTALGAPAMSLLR